MNSWLSKNSLLLHFYVKTHRTSYCLPDNLSDISTMFHYSNNVSMYYLYTMSLYLLRVLCWLIDNLSRNDYYPLILRYYVQKTNFVLYNFFTLLVKLFNKLWLSHHSTLFGSTFNCVPSVIIILQILQICPHLFKYNKSIPPNNVYELQASDKLYYNRNWIICILAPHKYSSC